MAKCRKTQYFSAFRPLFLQETVKLGNLAVRRSQVSFCQLVCGKVFQQEDLCVVISRQIIDADAAFPFGNNAAEMMTLVSIMIFIRRFPHGAIA